MPASKNKPAEMGIDAFLTGIKDPSRKQDCLALIEMMKKTTNCEPKLWGTSMVGFGDLHYRYESGREGDTFLLGFASRKTELVLYLGCALAIQDKSLKGLGKYKVGKGCLYIRRLEDVDLPTLRTLLSEAAAHNASAAAPR
jgi:hypothetical protein